MSKSQPENRVGSCFHQKALFLLLLWLGPCFQTQTQTLALDFQIDYRLHPDTQLLSAFDLCILSPQAELRLAEIRRPGQVFLGYISVGEIAPDAPHRERARKAGIRSLETNQIWKSTLVDLSQPEWTRFVVNDLAAEVVAKGYDGFFLDTADALDTLIERFPREKATLRAGMIGLVRGLREKYPDKKIILNRGFTVWEELKGQIDGVLIESVFQTVDLITGVAKAVPAADTEYLLGMIRKIQEAKLEVFVVDYTDPREKRMAREAAERIEGAGCHALVTTPELSGLVLAPLRETPRQLLCLFGSVEDEADGYSQWPLDSATGLIMQMPIEWLGCEVDYLNMNHEPLPSELDERYAGVIVDSYLTIEHAKEPKFVEWLIRQKDRGKKILFVGSLPIQDEGLRRRFAQGFGLGGTGREIRPVTDLRTVRQSGWMGFEAPVRTLSTGFLDLQAPAGSDVHLTVEGKDADGKSMVFDAAFVAPWGGMVMQPYLFFRQPDYLQMWLIQPFEFFKAALQLPAWPAPDSTTRDGLRIFYAHVDGDGFRHMSTVEAGKTSAEILYERVVLKYPFPFTCSIIESEIRAQIFDQKPEDEPRLKALAREIFANPKIEAGSHAYTHPFFWEKNSREAKLYEQPFLRLMQKYARTELDLEREIAGSVRYINEELLPPGKRVEIFLWSGNCRPPPEALAICRRLGIENMNGGDTTISRKHPSLTKVAARSTPMGKELQILAANQNENIYWDEVRSDKSDATFYGAYIHVLEAFERTETPRRLKPVNIYFHWYSGDNFAAYKALARAFDWAVNRPLHSMTASAYSRLVRDCRATRLLQRGDRHWVAVNRGQLRTYRFGDTALVPDLERSRGVTGFVADHGALYIHTDGSPRTDIVLTERRPSRPYLISSSAEIRFQESTGVGMSFETRDVRECKVRLGGLPALGAIRVRVNEDTREARADASGEMTLTLPPEAMVRLEVPSKP